MLLMPEHPTDPEDRKLLTLARATRQRARADQGAALRDTDGRTYAAASVALDSLRLSALAAAVAMAIASGASGLEAAVLLTDDAASDGDLAVLREFAGAGVPVLVGGPSGQVREQTTT